MGQAITHSPHSLHKSLSTLTASRAIREKKEYMAPSGHKNLQNPRYIKIQPARITTHKTAFQLKSIPASARYSSRIPNRINPPSRVPAGQIYLQNAGTGNPPKQNRFTRGLSWLKYLILALFVLNGNFEVNMLILLITYFENIMTNTKELMGYSRQIREWSISITRINNILNYSSRQQITFGINNNDYINGLVEFKNVNFSYIPDKKLIENLNLFIKPGQRVAIVGPTGCGKTTLINLLMRFYDVNSGSILVDEMDIKEITRHSLRKHYGMVLQETWLKSGTIRENIAFGKPDATEEEIIQAAKAVHAHGFIKRMPDGYNTFIREDGGSLSQGQKQLLCIARIMLCLPPMLILDEATSSIDTRTELKIQQAFAKLMEGRTSFIVAHRLSTIKEADMILVMKDGTIIEQGNHETLLKKNGFYANLYNSQFAK